VGDEERAETDIMRPLALLNDLVDRGLVRFEKDALVIPDLERLARAAER